MEILREWLSYINLGQFLKQNHPVTLIILGAIVFVLLVIAKFGCTFVRSRMEKWANAKPLHIKAQSGSEEKIIQSMDNDLFDKVIKETRDLLYVLIIFWGVRQLNLNQMYANLLSIIFFAWITWIAIKFLSVFVPFNLDIYLRRQGSTLDTSQTRSLLPIIKGIIWAAGLTFLLDNIGFHVSTIIAGLGIVGVAVGLAGQAILRDFFSYIVILLDKPFAIGDFVILSNGKCGQVTYIGPKTTRLLNLDDNVIVCANTEMTSGILENQGPISHREVTVEIGVAYAVPMETVRRVPAVLKEVINSFPQCSFERACMLKFGPANYVFQLIYHVLPQPGGIRQFMETQSEVNLAFTERMNKEGMGGAYPTETILLTHNNPLQIVGQTQDQKYTKA